MNDDRSMVFEDFPEYISIDETYLVKISVCAAREDLRRDFLV